MATRTKGRVARNMIHWVSQKTYLQNILTGIFALHACFVLLWWLISGASFFMGLPEVLLMLACSGVLVAGFYLMRPGTQPVVLMIALFFLAFVHIRLTAFLVLPSGAIGFLDLPPFTEDEIREAMSYVMIGTGALLLGVQFVGWAADRAFDRERLAAAFPGPLQRSFITLGGLVLLWTLALAGNFVAEPFLREGYLPADIGWFTRLFSIDTALMISLVWLVARRDVTGAEWWTVALLVVVWLGVSILGGSRGGSLRIAMVVFAVLAARYLIHPITPRALVAGFIVMALVGTMGGFAGQIFRLKNVGLEDPVAGAFYDFSRQDIYQRITPGELSLWTVEARADAENAFGKIGRWRSYLRSQIDTPDTIYFTITERLNPLLARLGTIDYGVQAMTREGDEAMLDKYIRSPYAFKNIANALVPGDVFGYVTISTAQVFNIAYRGYDEAFAERHYLSEPWTIWGLAKILFGSWGGLLFLFAVGGLLQAGYAVTDLLPGESGLVARTMYLFIFVYGGINMFGIDHVVVVGIHYAISALSALSLLFVFSRLSRHFKARRAPEA